MSRAITCDSHGRAPWQGEVICAPDAGGCGRVWKLSGAAAHFPPQSCGKHCVCDRPLTGPQSTARAICPFCYRQKRREQKAAAS